MWTSPDGDYFVPHLGLSGEISSDLSDKSPIRTLRRSLRAMSWGLIGFYKLIMIELAGRFDLGRLECRRRISDKH